MPQKVRVAGRYYVPGPDRGIGALLTAASWIVQRLPGEVVERHRAECIEELARAEIITIQVIPTIGVRVWTGDAFSLTYPAQLMFPSLATKRPVAGRRRRLLRRPKLHRVSLVSWLGAPGHGDVRRGRPGEDCLEVT